jgi:hypothetical protein
VYSGCCPAPHQNCHGGAGGGGGSGANGFGFGLADPGGGSLPIELLNFHAEVLNKKVLLNWTTASEINNDYFTIERSKNNVEWTSIAQINGAGNSTTEIKYSSEDFPNETSIYYYRLKQTDFDGQFSYSNIEVVDLKKLENISIYPNPSNKFFVVESSEINLLRLYLRNITGEKIYATVNYLNDKAIFDTSLLPEGLYLLSIEKDYKIIKMQKIVVNK